MDLIDRKKLYQDLMEEKDETYHQAMQNIPDLYQLMLSVPTREVINKQPAVDAVPVVHGHWEIDKETEEYICSECGKDTCGYLDMEDEFFDENGVKGWRLTQPNYCKHCGAKMDEDIKSTENGKNC